MRFLSLKLSILIISLAAIGMTSCSNKTEQFETELLTDYTQFAVGKYITYRVDSLVFPNFGRAEAIHKYQVKHVIDAQITDNLGRPSYRVFRFIRDSVDLTSWTDAQAWVPNGSYQITLLPDQLEVIEDNLRFIKLHLPMKEGSTWKGNKYLGNNAYNSLYEFSNDDLMGKWDFYFDNFSSSFNYRDQLYNDVWTIEGADEIYNYPITDPTAYAARTRVVEKYAKNTGLVYREYEMWEYQPNTTGTGGPFKTGFGVTMWMVDHN
jgi:hypothetical protein